ncbi:hypothetical protein Hsw_0827 [Sporocytophaga myxococcoides]|uniref:Acyltransferase 3 domain-containing protein n=1 Tax=Sporocytophaga myxococcoides TaxID=153721 RepID=A0A098LCM0_9BACT|nr:acyltransferase [Sporocytophaga myxococcoides]GAL83778.1 hypothetical protein Hsw_0827 [Sporocytophaga myxococcoides]
MTNLSIKSSENLSNLHILRGLTALYVLIYHAKFILWCGGNEYIKAYPMHNWGIGDYLVFASDIFSSAGFEMVLVFFVLSGFFIAKSFNKKRWSLRDFYLKRIARIYPPYLFSLLFSVIVILLIGQINADLYSLDIPFERNQRLKVAYENLNFKSIAYSLFFISTKEYIGMNIVYWSLLIEVVFYIIIPFVIVRPVIYFILSLICAIFMRYTPLAYFTFLSEYSIYFALGVLIFKYKDISVVTIIEKSKYIFLILIITLIFSVVILSALKLKYYSSFTAALLSLFSIFFLLKVQLHEGWVLKRLKFLGEISYSLYLFHFPVLLLIYALLTKYTGSYNFYSRVYWVSIPIALLVAYCCYGFIEKRSKLMIDVFRNRRSLRMEIEE